jgi:hypothetical protein
MKRVVIQYKVKPEQAEHNGELLVVSSVRVLVARGVARP